MELSSSTIQVVCGMPQRDGFAWSTAVSTNVSHLPKRPSPPNREVALFRKYILDQAGEHVRALFSLKILFTVYCR
jgi:hypothetical protein